jgi:hypothetical protein
VQAATWKTDNDITRLYRRSIDNPGPIQKANGKSSQITFLTLIQTGHFRGFPANQWATGQLTPFNNSGYDGFGLFHLQLARCVVIEEKEWLRSAHNKVIHGHGD